MNEAPGAGARPSTVAITKMLAEAEVARRRAFRPWLLATLLPLLLGGALLAFTSYAVAKRLSRLGELDREIAKKELDLAEKDRLIDEKEQALAAKSQVIARVYEENPAARAEIISAIEANPTAAAATPRVFIHYPDKGQKARADQLRGAVRGLGYIVPNTELVAAARVNAEVRYFFDDDREAAEKVAAALSGQGLRLPATRRNAPGAKPGLVEVWLPADAAPPTNDDRNPRADASAARDRLQDALQNSNRAAQNSNRPTQNANRPSARPSPGRPYSARPPQ